MYSVPPVVIPWSEQPIHFLDFEGSVSSGILEYGVATLHRGAITGLRSRLCRPKGVIPPQDTAVHGLTDRDLAGRDNAIERRCDLSVVVVELRKLRVCLVLIERRLRRVRRRGRHDRPVVRRRRARLAAIDTSVSGRKPWLTVLMVTMIFCFGFVVGNMFQVPALHTLDQAVHQITKTTHPICEYYSPIGNRFDFIAFG